MSLKNNYEPLVSVIACPHADARLAVESVAAQSYRNWELCDAPGAEASRGELLLFLQPGCALERDHLRRSVEAFAETGDGLDLVYCDAHFNCPSRTDREDLFQRAVALPYHLLGAVCGEEFSANLRDRVPPPVPLGPLSGAPFTWHKPDWGADGPKTLARCNFIGLSDAVMTRSAYEAAGGLKESADSGWRLWLDMLRAGHRAFRRIPHVGTRYTTADLFHHRQSYTRSVSRQNGQTDRAAPSPRPAAVHRARPRVLFIGEALAISHVARPALLAAHLHREGYEVCLARDPRYNGIIPCDGFATADIVSLSGAVAMQRLARAEPVYDAATLDAYVQDDLKLLRDFQPDIVVGDQRHSLAVSSRLADVPYVNIADAQWCPATADEYEVPDSPLSRLIGAPLSNLLFQFARPAAFAFHTMPLNVVRLKYGLSGIGPDIKSFFTYGDYTVYPNDPALFPLAKRLPPGHSFIGPLVWSAAAGLPEWWAAIPEDRPVVYVSLGSTGPAGLLGTIFDVLADMPVTAVVVTAGRDKAAKVPENVHVAEFLPGGEAARRSRLVICNGGSMSGQQALSAGAPYLGIVSNLDQMLFTKAVHRAGACEWLRAGETTVGNLRPLVQHMLTQDRYRSVARKLGSRAAGWDSRGNFAALVGNICESRNQERYRTA